MKEPKSRLGKLQQKFFKSGFDDNPIISTQELNKLAEGLREVAEYMQDRGDSSMRYCLLLELESVENIIFNRKNRP
jgi:hypothetical protein